MCGAVMERLSSNKNPFKKRDVLLFKRWAEISELCLGLCHRNTTHTSLSSHFNNRLERCLFSFILLRAFCPRVRLFRGEPSQQFTFIVSISLPSYHPLLGHFLEQPSMPYILMDTVNNQIYSSVTAAPLRIQWCIKSNRCQLKFNQYFDETLLPSSPINLSS